MCIIDGNFFQCSKVICKTNGEPRSSECSKVYQHNVKICIGLREEYFTIAFLLCVTLYQKGNVFGSKILNQIFTGNTSFKVPWL